MTLCSSTFLPDRRFAKWEMRHYTRYYYIIFLPFVKKKLLKKCL